MSVIPVFVAMTVRVLDLVPRVASLIVAVLVRMVVSVIVPVLATIVVRVIRMSLAHEAATVLVFVA